MQRDLGLLLLQCKDYRDFLGLYFNPPEGIQVKPKWTYQLFSQRAGFSSKSYIYAVIHTEKKLTLESAEKVVQALKLSKSWAEYFRLLVKKSNGAAIETTQIQNLATKLRNNLLVRREEAGLKKIPSDISPFVATVYASLGSEKIGASFVEIKKRARLPDKVIHAALEKMCEAGLAQKQQDRYLVGNATNINVEGLGISLAYNFKHSTELMLKRQRKGKNENSAFYMNSFSVKSADLPRLATALKNLLSEYVVEAEFSEGDCVAEVVCALTSNAAE